MAKVREEPELILHTVRCCVCGQEPTCCPGRIRNPVLWSVAYGKKPGNPGSGKTGQV